MKNWIAGVIVLAALVTVGLWVWEGYPSRDRLKEQGNQMVAAVEDYYARHGRYPDSLAAAGVVAPRHGYGPWRYESLDGRSFMLAVGDYGRDHFVLYHTGPQGEWAVDD